MGEAIAIVQARMGSSRLPGKVMMEVNGKPLIGYLLERLQRCAPQIDTVIACPMRDVHSELGRYLLAGEHEVFFVDGDENDLVNRFAKTIEGLRAVMRSPRWFVRVCADSPLLDPAVVRNACYADRDGDSGYTYFGGKLPHGQQIERFTVSTFMRDSQKIAGDAREHPGLYYGLRAMQAEATALNSLPSLSVDTAEDFDRIAGIIERMRRPHWTYSWRECLKLCD